MKFWLFSVSMVLFLNGCDVQINKSISIDDNLKIDKNLITVNGNINIGRSCVINGDLSTVNGAITVDKDSRINGSLKTVNGGVIIDSNNLLNGSISTINGSVQTDSAVQVTGDLSSITGEINLKNTYLKGNLSTQFGNINLRNKSVIDGRIVIENNPDIPEKLRKVSIVLSDSSQVKNGIINNNRLVTVTLLQQNGSHVSGNIVDVDIVQPEIEKLP